MTRTRYVGDRGELSQAVNYYKDEGYFKTSESATSVTLKYRNYGGVVKQFAVLLLAGWWTLGLANALYGMYAAHVSRDVVEVCVRGGGDSNDIPDAEDLSIPSSVVEQEAKAEAARKEADK